MIPARNVRLKRAYEPASTSDGQRILVDRLWPRGVRKSELKIDQWMKEVAPSGELRAWFGHAPKRWDEFQRRYRRELSDHADMVSDLRCRARCGPVTLIYSARDDKHNDAVVLRKTVLGRPIP